MKVRNLIKMSVLKTLGGRYYRGTFLPEVAKEQGWSKEETLKYLLQKAGISIVKLVIILKVVIVG